MPTVEYNSLERVHDVEHTRAPSDSRPVLEKGRSSRITSGAPWKKCLAIAVVAFMVATAFVMLAPSAPKKALTPGEDKRVDTEVGGEIRKVDYTISNIGESYKKPLDYSLLGRHQSNLPGLSAWWTEREEIWNDTIVHNSYPYVIAYTPYTDALVTPAPPQTPWSTHSFYRNTMNAENISQLATGADQDPWIVPIMGDQGLDGGWVNMSLYFTYFTAQEYLDIDDGIHYANSFYGLTGTDLINWSGAFQTYKNDGWFSELQGHWDFDRKAASKFLGLAGAGPLSDQFNTTGPTNLAAKWRQEWINDGDTLMPLDIYAAYDYSLYAGNGPVFIKLKLDLANCTNNKLAIWFWSHTWGIECLLTRYLETVGIYKNLEPYMEDWYLNGTLGPANGDIHSSQTSVYHMTAWRDTDPGAYFNPAWLLEPQHIDYTADLASDTWVSQFDDYMWHYWQYGKDYEPTRICWIPGQANYGNPVHYWATPRTWDLAADETLTIKLPMSTPGWGITPYWSDTTTKPGLAVGEMNAHGMTGEWVLGHGWPSKLYSTTYYDPATKTITIPGGSTWDPKLNHDPAYWVTPAGTSVYEQGSPTVLLDISKVSKYDMTILGGPTYYPYKKYILQVQPRDLANSQVYCNQTVELPAVAGVTYGATTHTFLWNETSWNTTVYINISTGVTIDLTSRDQYFYLDISDAFTFVVQPCFDLNVVKGWNFITAPRVGYGHKASTLGLAKFDTVASYNVTSKLYDKTYLVGVSPSTQDFVIAQSTAYWVSVNQNETLHLYGSVPTDPQVRSVILNGTSWVNLAFNTLNTTWKASKVLTMVSGGNVTTVAWLNPATKVYKTYIANVTPSDYTLIPGQGYWVSVNVVGIKTVTFTYTP